MSLLYAVGDAHGRADLLEKLLDAIKRDAETINAEPVIIFLGDIVDRGPDSRQAMDLVQAAIGDYPGSSLILGNHDALFSAFLNGTYTDNLAIHWLFSLGGVATIESYLPNRPEKLDDIQDALLDHFGHHQALLNGAVDKVITEQVCFVHAGIRPGVPLVDQDPHDLRWIRKEFLRYDQPFEKFVIHGHTPTENDLPDVRSNRICIDTGAYATGRLTATAIKTGEVPRFICAAERPAGGVSIEHFGPDRS